MIGMMGRLSNKTITKVLLGGLVLIFIFFGSGSFVSSKDTIVSIDGKSAISLEELAKEKRVVLQSLSRYYPDIDLNSININQLAIEQLVRNKLIDLEVKNLGLVISDSLVLDLIKKDKLFHNDKGEFDKNLFKKILDANHIRESDYINGLKLSIAASFFSRNMVNFSVPDYIAQQFYTYDNQERVVELFVVEESSKKDGLSVSDKEIENFYNSNKNNFYAPEFREIEYAEFRASHQDGKGEDLQRIQDIEKSIEEGVSLKEISIKHKLLYTKLPKVDMSGLNASGQTNKSVPASAKFLNEAFSLGEGVASDVIKIDNKYYVINVIKIEPKHLIPLEKVRSSIISELKDQKSTTDTAKLAADIRQEAIKNSISPKHVNKFKTKIVKLKRPKSDIVVESILAGNIVSIFSLEGLGQYSDVFRLDNGSFAFAKLKSINRPVSKVSKDAYPNLPQIFSGIVNQDFMNYLHKKYKVEINYNNLNN